MVKKATMASCHCLAWVLVVAVVVISSTSSTSSTTSTSVEALNFSPPTVRSSRSSPVRTAKSTTTTKSFVRVRVRERFRRLEMRGLDNGDESDERDSRNMLGFQRDLVSKIGFSSRDYSSLPRQSSTALELWNKKKNTNGDGEKKEIDGKPKNNKKISSWFRSKKEPEDDGNSSNSSSNKTNNNKKGVALNGQNDAADDDASVWYKFASKFEGIRDEVSQKIVSVLPAPFVELLANIFARVKLAIPGLKIAFLSFSAGAVLTFGAILVPVYSSVESLSQPVTLFETILADLDAGYVDPVDTNKLFETGVSAMLKSLDPYTEFEAKEEAQQMNEGIMGRYGGVGLVISGATPRDMTEIQKMTGGSSSMQKESTPKGSKLLPDDAIQDSMDDSNSNSNSQSSNTNTNTNTKSGDGNKFVDNRNNDALDDDDEEEEDPIIKEKRKEQMRALAKAQDKGITVVSAFEGYAFDYGMRTGDRLTKVDDLVIEKGKTTVEDVRNVLRGVPGTTVSIEFERDGVKGPQEITMPRAVVRLRDVKLATLVGKPSDGIGYISLSGFAQNAGNEVRGAILALEQAAEDASNGEHSLKGLILDMRGNPGGLLTSAVDVASLLVPNGSDIVSAKGRGFPGVTYRSRSEPLLDKNTKLAVLVNRGTASAAEIVSGAVQDLDVGIIVGTDRTFGKGLVQNVEDLPFNTALKFTVAKYYTPSGRCIQSINYKEGGVGDENGGKYTASRVSNKDRQVFYTKSGRAVRDGGGVEADYKVPAPKASALEITLLRSDVMNEYASQWSKKYELTNNFEVTDDIYRDFQDFVDAKSKSGDLKLEAIYSSPLDDLKRALKQSGYKAAESEVEQLKTQIVKEVKKDFDRYKKDIKEDIATSILSRYIPESMIMERNLKTDTQVQAAIKLLGNDKSFSKILAKGSSDERSLQDGVRDNSLNVASSALDDESRDGGSFRLEF